MIFCTVGTFGFGLAPVFWIAAVSRFLVGIGGSFCFLSGVRLASRWFPPRRMALLTGLIVTMAFIGGWVAQTPMTALVSHFGWREALVMDGFLGVVLTIWIWLIVKDRPAHQLEKATADYNHLKQMGVWKAAWRVLKNVQNWYGGLYTSLLNLPIFFLGAMWGKMYLEQIQHFSADKAAFICSLLFIGSIVGSPLMGFVSDKMRRRKLPMIIGALLSILVVLPIVFIPHLSFTAFCVLFFLLGLITCAQVISYPLAAEHNPSVLTGSAVSIVSMTCMLGGALGLPFSGWVLDLGWDHTVVHGVPVYSAASYHHALLIMPIAFAIGLVMSLLVKETRCKPQVTEH
jgi:sugar phosphate permease